MNTTQTIALLRKCLNEDPTLEDEEIEEKNWIAQAIKKKGSLRKTLHAKKGKNIPASALRKAAKKGGKTGKRARLALTLKSFRKK